MSNYLYHKTKTYEEFDISKYEDQMPDPTLIAKKYGSKLRSQFSYVNSDVFEGSDEERHRRSTNGPKNITSNQELPDIDDQKVEKWGNQEGSSITEVGKKTGQQKLGSSSEVSVPQN